MSKKKKILPELRFPKFANNETWAARKLADVLFERREKNTGKEEVYSVSVHKGVVNQIEHLGRVFASSNTDNYKRVLPGDIIYTKSPTGDFPFGIIKQSKVSKPVIVSPLYGVFKPETIDLGVILEAYFEYPERTINYLSSIIQKGAKNTINIHNDTFLSKSLVLPLDKEEQSKIASFLLSIDKVIISYTEKLELLRDHKKGLMQNLFPQEGETIPKLSFSNNTPWAEFSLPDMVYFQEGPGIMAEDFRNEGVPLVRLSGIGGTTVTLDGCNFLDPDMVKKKWEHFRLTLNDLVISTSATFGLTSIVTKDAIGAVFYTGLIRFRPINKNLNLGYLKAFLGSPLFERQAKLAAVGGGIKHFGPSHLRQMKICLPAIDEQQKIASCFYALDEIITAYAEAIEQLKLYKKGLMQRLFPQAID